MGTPYAPRPPRLRPSLAWLLLTFLLLIGGIGGCSGLLYSGVRHAINVRTFDQPGPVSIDAGKYTLYSTGPSVSLVAPNGTRVPLKNYSSDLTITENSAKYHAIKTFVAARPGTYRLTLSGAGSAAIGHGLKLNVARIGIGLALGFVCAFAAIGVAVIVFMGRHRRRPPYGGDPNHQPPAPGRP